MRLRISWAYIFVIAMVVIAGLTISYNNYVASELKKNEVNYVEIWAKAQQALVDSKDGCDYTFHFDVVEKNTTIPIMLVDDEGNIIDARNFSKPFDGVNHLPFFERKKQELMKNDPIAIGDDNFKQWLYHDTSNLVKSLEQFPYMQLFIFLVLIVFSLFILSTRRKMEQERVWVGMAKETAHQLGTPISSLLGWIEHIRQMYPEDQDINEIAEEIEKDTQLLTLVADRFSKIGATPELFSEDIYKVLTSHHQYIKERASRRIEFIFPQSETPCHVKINRLLFDWVVENLLKNALDALSGEGTIQVNVSTSDRFVFIDVKDSGKGIRREDVRHIFKPGFSTKKRGWGLGLSLSKRIIETYHKGRIFVLETQKDKGTTFRIKLHKP